LASISRIYTPANLLQSPVEVFLNVAPPASSASPVDGIDTLQITLDPKGFPTPVDTGGVGFHVGHIDGPSTFSITEKVNEIFDDSHENAVDVGFDTIECEIDVNIKETANLARYLSYISTKQLGSYETDGTAEVVTLGGQFNSCFSPITVLLLAQTRDCAGLYIYVMLYRATLQASLVNTFTRSKESVWKLKFRGLMDFTRQQGDELMQIWRAKAAA
jgi:hypothetical protein